MLDKSELVNKFSKDAQQLENKIEKSKLYNIRNAVIRALMKSGIALDYALPFILAAIIIASSKSAKGNAPFHIDDVIEKAKIETIDTSYGSHFENISYDYDYDTSLIEYSTGWVINDRGLYERTVTHYRLNDELDLSEIDKVLSMTKEEIENILIITNIETIRKNTLNPEDEIYSEDALIVINHLDSEEDTITRKETTGENVLNSIGFIIIALCWGNTFRVTEKLFVKTYIRDKIRQYEPLFRKINRDELEEMKKILELKKQNLALITQSEENIESNGYSHTLRRV